MGVSACSTRRKEVTIHSRASPCSPSNSSPSSPEQAPIVRAAQSPTVIDAAYAYADLGLSVLPLRGKIPALRAWARYQQARASPQTIRAWALAGLFTNVGIVCGGVSGGLPPSGGLVVIDLDGEAAYAAFAAIFPELTATYTVATGSGHGKHVYLFVRVLPVSVRALHTPIGNLEIRSTGLQVAAPPSIHPSGRPYTVLHALDVLRVPDLAAVHRWVMAFQRPAMPPTRRPAPTSRANPSLVTALTGYFVAAGYRANGDWLNGPCIYPERHQHDDAKPSFGFNRRSGYGWCFVCGSMLAKDLVAQLGIVTQGRI